MAKRLSAGEWMRRAIDSGRETVKSIASKIGRSASTVRDVISGRRPGEKLRETARDLAQGKKDYAIPEGPKRIAPKAAPSPKGAPEAKPVPAGVSAMDRAEGQLSALDRAGIDKVVIHVTSKQTGRSFTLGAKGGISLDTIHRAPSLGDFLSIQGARQLYEIDWDVVSEIEFEEY